jgi:hypothetical protein
MDKGLPMTKVPIDSNVIKIPVEAMARLQVEQVVKDKIAQYESVKLRKRKGQPGYV